MSHVAVAKAADLGTRKPRAVDERSVIEPVSEYRVFAPDQRGNDADIGHVAARKQQAGAPHVAGQSLLQRLVQCVMAADQV